MEERLTICGYPLQIDVISGASIVVPENGVVQISHEEILTYDEITRISRCMTGLGIRKIKLTGGEPLIRKNCATLVRMLKRTSWHRKSDINDLNGR